MLLLRLILDYFNKCAFKYYIAISVDDSCYFMLISIRTNPNSQIDWKNFVWLLENCDNELNYTNPFFSNLISNFNLISLERSGLT